MLADGTTTVRSVPRGFGISRLRRQLSKKYTISCVLESLIFGRLPLWGPKQKSNGALPSSAFLSIKTFRNERLRQLCAQKRKPQTYSMTSSTRAGGVGELSMPSGLGCLAIDREVELPGLLDEHFSNCGQLLDLGDNS
jgi:hypothetical protein